MPHEFILAYLFPLRPLVKKMFGNYAIYIDNKIYLATRDHKDKPIDNGIWLATTVLHHASLKCQFPALTHLKLYHIKQWLLLPVESVDFEETALAICELIKSGDPRIGVLVQKNN